MNKNPHSFLFFLILLLCCNYQAQSQEKSESYYYNKVTKPETSQDLYEGYLYFKNQKEESIRNKDIEGVAYALNMISISQTSIGAYYDAENSAIEALEILDNLETNQKFIDKQKKSAYASLGIIYNNLEKPRQAILSSKSALTFAENAIDSSYLYNNMGNNYIKEKDYINAEKQYADAYKLLEPTTDSVAMAVSLDNWGVAQAKLHNPAGINKMNNALSLRKRLKNERRIYTSYKHLSKYYADEENLSLAKSYADSGLVLAIKYSAEYRQDALSNSLRLSDDSTVTAYLNLNDSIAKSKLINENKYSGAKYNFDVEKEKKERALVQNAEEKAKNKTYQFVVLLVLVLAAALFIILSTRHRKKRLEQVYTTETRISKRVHDEVANDIYRVMTKLQSDAMTSNSLMDDLESIYDKTRDISRENSMIDVDGDFRQLLKDLFLGYKSATLNIITKYGPLLQWDDVSTLKKMAIYRVLQELITNTKKHSQASIALIEFSKSPKGLSIVYKDNGAGGALKSKNGLQNVESRIEALNGTVTFSSEANKGFTAHIII